MKKSIPIYFLYLLFFTGVSAQIPPGYYDPANGKTGKALQQALHDIIQNHHYVMYNTVWACFPLTDKKPDSTVWDIYSDIPGSSPPYFYQFDMDQCGSSGAGPGEDVCYDREHSWPKSWFGGEIYPMYSDMFILYPTDSYVNTRRLNYPYGTVAQPQWTSMNGSRLGICTWTGYSGKVFEPIDEYKGDLARTYFYMSVRYYDEDAEWPGSEMTTGSQLKTWSLNLLKYWNSLDPVSQKETDRNNAVFFIQGNRNPFIDHPEYSSKIWADGTGVDEDNTFKLRIFPTPAHDNCTLTLPEWFNPQTSTVNITSLSGVRVLANSLNDKISLILDIHNLPAGVYFVTISGSGNSGYYHGKIIKD
jgi:endonuclease I